MLYSYIKSFRLLLASFSFSSYWLTISLFFNLSRSKVSSLVVSLIGIFVWSISMTSTGVVFLFLGLWLVSRFSKLVEFIFTLSLVCSLVFISTSIMLPSLPGVRNDCFL